MQRPKAKVSFVDPAKRIVTTTASVATVTSDADADAALAGVIDAVNTCPVIILDTKDGGKILTTLTAEPQSDVGQHGFRLTVEA